MFKRKDTVVIIGNGFDLAHGYNTRYTDFFIGSSDRATHLKELYTDYFSIKDYENGNVWSNFEELIKEHTLQIFLEHFNDADEELLRVIEYVNSFIELCSDYFKEYLMEEMEKDELSHVVFDNIGKYITDKAHVLNFNYTPVAERYGCTPFYVHGSLKEDYILLGYDNRVDPDVIEYHAACYSKENLRKRLEFRRLILEKYNDMSDELMQQWIQIEKEFSSLKGFSEDDIQKIPEEESRQIIGEFLKSYDYNPYPFDCKEIENIIVIGHGMVADNDYLSNMISACNNLKKAIIFRYSLDTDEDIEKKKRYFDSNKCEISVEQYGCKRLK